VSDKEVDVMKRDDPAEWARKRYGFIPDQKTLARIIAKPLKNAAVQSTETAKR